MTPRELAVYAKARGGYLAARQRLTENNLYMLAALVRRAVWDKHGLPQPEELFGRQRRGAAAMSDEAMYRQVLALNKALGGEEL